MCGSVVLCVELMRIEPSPSQVRQDAGLASVHGTGRDFRCFAIGAGAAVGTERLGKTDYVVLLRIIFALAQRQPAVNSRHIHRDITELGGRGAMLFFVPRMSNSGGERRSDRTGAHSTRNSPAYRQPRFRWWARTCAHHRPNPKREVFVRSVCATCSARSRLGTEHRNWSHSVECDENLDTRWCNFLCTRGR